MKARHLAGVAGVAVLALGLAACGSSSSSPPATQSTAAPTGPVTITWSASPIAQVGIRAYLIKQFEAAYPNITVNLVSAPTNTDTNRSTLTTQISGGATSPDVFMGDVIWPAQFGAKGLALPLSDYLPASFFSGFAPGLVTGASYKGKVYGAPFFADQGFLYYRKDLLSKYNLPVPTTWEQLVTDSKTLQSKNAVKYGYVWQGASYEGLTCDWVEFLADAGGSVLNTAGTKASVDSPAALKALTFMRSLITSGVSPAGVTTFQEPQAMQAFDAGDAAFLRNWDYAYANANNPSDSKVVGKVGVAPMPTFAGQPTPGYSAVGGWNNYINPHSKNIGADLVFIKWLSGTDSQTILSTKYTEIPTLQSVRAAVATSSPNAVLKIVGQTKLIARPSFTPAYPQVSQSMYTNLNSALAGSVPPSSALATAASQINTALAGTGL
ncbi:MAG: ABC transporter substrate-binding protein [Actinomycetes bacterium]